MKNNYQVCNECCNDLDLEINSFIESRCHRKFCDICGYSTNDYLSMISKDIVDEKIKGVEKMSETIIELDSANGFIIGDSISFETYDKRWWKRLWYFLTFRDPPIICEYRNIIKIDDNNIWVK